jgi:uridine kinase
MIVAICGGSCSGKTTMALQFKDACILSMDDFYVGKSKMKEPYNFDEPSAIDLKKIAEVLRELKTGVKQVEIPKYDMKTSEPSGTQVLKNKKLVIFEGIFSLLTKELRDLCDLKIYLDVPVDERVRRRISRDVEKGRSTVDTLEWSKTVECMHDLHVENQKNYADIVVPVNY